jgi:hypothetical protein
VFYRSDKEICDVIKGFEGRTLLRSDWTHAAHLTVALYYCVVHPFGVAKNLMSDGICWLNDKHGTPNNDTNGYHETLTIFWLRTVANFIAENSRERTFFILANKLLTEYSDSSLPLKHYRPETLFSTEARQQFVEPDLRRQRARFASTILALKPCVQSESDEPSGFLFGAIQRPDIPIQL